MILVRAIYGPPITFLGPTCRRAGHELPVGPSGCTRPTASSPGCRPGPDAMAGHRPPRRVRGRRHLPVPRPLQPRAPHRAVQVARPGRHRDDPRPRDRRPARPPQRAIGGEAGMRRMTSRDPPSWRSGTPEQTVADGLAPARLRV
jgi:hypothetical protein